MTEDRKAAEAAVKAAERAYDGAAKKADTAREKYVELNVIRNTAARALAHARTHPALFDDDPLLVVDPAAGVNPSPVRVTGNTFTATVDTKETVIHRLPQPTTPQDVATYVAPPAPVADVTHLEEAPPETDATPPWQQPAVAPEAPKTRRVGSRRKKADEPVAVEQPVALADPNPPAAEPTVQQQPQFTPDGFPIEGDDGTYNPF